MWLVWLVWQHLYLKIAAYKRGALSVIENVTFANDLERHWIQNHPAILYDVKLIQRAIELYDEYMVTTYAEKLGAKKSIFTNQAAPILLPMRLSTVRV